MIQPKYSPEEALERVKLMMKYDTSKTLNENKEIIFEQNAAGVLANTLKGAAAGAAIGAIGLNPVTITLGAISGGLSGLINSFTGLGPARDKCKKLFNSCSAQKDQIGKPTMDDSTLDSLADQLNDAMENAGFLNGTDEDNIKNVFSSIQTIPDLCGLVKNYGESYNKYLFDALDYDLEDDKEWSTYVALPLRNAIRNTKIIEPTANTDKSSSPKTGGSSAPTSKYTQCDGTYKVNCKSEVIRKVQGCLGMPAKYQTGNFGQITKGELAKQFPQFKDSFTDDDVYEIICKKNTETTGSDNKPDNITFDKNLNYKPKGLNAISNQQREYYRNTLDNQNLAGQPIVSKP
jgi:hypothetical protein